MNSQTSNDPLHIGLVVYGDLSTASGGFRYDRKLVEFCRARGDTVDVILLPWRSYPRNVVSGLSPTVRAQLNRPVDLLVVDGLCHPSLWRHVSRLGEPGVVVGLLHHIQSDDPTERFGRFFEPFERRFLRGLDATIATSEFTQTRAARLAPCVTDRPALIAPPGGRAADRNRTAAAATQRPPRTADDPFELLFVGSVVPRKDPRTLLSAVASVRDRLGDWRLTLIGSHAADPSYARSVVDHAASLGIADRVTFAGEVSKATLEAAFERSHVCCVPSRYEGFGMVYLEAMEHGVVPIASARGGAAEFIDHTNNGFLVDPEDERAIASHLTALANDSAQLATMSRRAREAAAAHPTWDETLRAVRTFLSHVVDAERG